MFLLANQRALDSMSTPTDITSPLGRALRHMYAAAGGADGPLGDRPRPVALILLRALSRNPYVCAGEDLLLLGAPTAET